MATTIRRRFSGTHPTKKYRGLYGLVPVRTSADVYVIEQDGKIALSMNGTAVMSWVELIQFVREIGEKIDGC
jgi:hypothetical protein